MDDATTPDDLDLGCFSLSLPVADLDASLAFYAALGFAEIGGEGSWRIIGNGPTKIGLFAEHLDQPILTFNPGLAQEFTPAAEGLPAPLEAFTDVREIERRLVAAGVPLEKGTESAEGPDHILLRDPDGNLVMFDQFF
jgi:catechol 2,3-dioxygenase-like lactoylglutathione lyase family enzyme